MGADKRASRAPVAGGQQRRDVTSGDDPARVRAGVLEVDGDIDHCCEDDSVNSRVVAFRLAHASEPGIAPVLAHSANGSVHSLGGGWLAATGRSIEGV